jgi:hypothetical protein
MTGLLRRRRECNEQNAAEAASLRYHVAPDVRASLHPDGVVLIHLGKGTVFSANRVGARIWSGAAERWSMGKLTDFLSVEFHIPAEIAQRDAAAFLEQLQAEGLLVADAS